MGINTLEMAKIFQTELDKQSVQGLTTGWMDANSGRVKYSGGNEVKIPKMSVQGLGDYDRSKGYKNGAITLTYETKEMTQDRGRRFMLDAMDVDETNFVTEAGAVMGEFQRVEVLPEIDAYRISKIATDVLTANKNGMIKAGYTPAKGILKEIKIAQKEIGKQGYKGQIMIHISPDAMMELELELGANHVFDNTSIANALTEVKTIDNMVFIPTASDRMYTSIEIMDGESEGQEAGGFKAGSSAKEINFIAIPKRAPIAVTKQDILRIFDPLTNQGANAWGMDYRRFHDVWTLDNEIGGIYLCTK